MEDATWQKKLKKTLNENINKNIMFIEGRDIGVLNHPFYIKHEKMLEGKSI